MVARLADKRNKQVIFRYCPTFTYCVSEIDNIKVDHTKDINVMMAMYNVNYSK